MKLFVPDWYPYKYLASSLEQLLKTPLPRCSKAGVVNAPAIGNHWQFIALLDGSDIIIGMTGIGEALDRKYPDRGILGTTPIDRAEVRSFTSKIEELFWCIVFSDVANHPSFVRPVWDENSGARERTLDELPFRMDGIEIFAEQRTTRYIASDRPSLADAFLAATFAVGERQGIYSAMARPSLEKWKQENLHGDPFSNVHSSATA
jgi:glutathione S-transferase